MTHPPEESLPAPLDLEQFRKDAYRAVDWVVDYLASVEELPVLSQVTPDDVRSQLPADPPETGQTMSEILDDLQTLVLPGITHWQSPNFFAYFPANSSPASIIGEMISAGLGVQGMLWTTSPACTEIETVIMDWLVHMLGLPDAYLSTSAGGGVIQDSASSATLCALLAARERATGGRSNETGETGRLVAYASTQAHSSMTKACMIAGIGRNCLRQIDVDQQFAMRPDALAEQIRRDLIDGYRPFFVCACVGTTSSLAMDPIRAIANVSRRYGLWLHIDAAMAGTAAICPEFRSMHDGIELADSYTFNPHKWMFTNFDCNAFFVTERARLTTALNIMPDYLQNKATASGQVIDYRDWQIPLGRRFRALKLWFVIRHFGIAGLREQIRRHVGYARWIAGQIQVNDHFELAAPPMLNLVCFRHKKGDAASKAILETLNRSGRMYLTNTSLDEHYVIRMCIGQTYVQRRHVEAAWQHLCAVAADQTIVSVGQYQKRG